MIQRAGLLLQTQDTDRRFSGLSRLYGDDMAQRIRRAHVVVVGIGGVGSWAAEALARSGVGKRYGHKMQVKTSDPILPIFAEC